MGYLQSILVLMGAALLGAPSGSLGQALHHGTVSAGTVAASGGTHQLAATTGEAAVGAPMEGPFALTSGFWQVVLADTAATPTAAPDRNVPAEIPDRFRVRPNYPNPFNPATQVVVDLPRAARVSVTVYDALGREVMRVPSQTLQPGRGQTIRIEASGLSSGTYIYRVRARMAEGTQTATGRMMLLK